VSKDCRRAHSHRVDVTCRAVVLQNHLWNWSWSRSSPLCDFHLYFGNPRSFSSRSKRGVAQLTLLCMGNAFTGGLLSIQTVTSAFLLINTELGEEKNLVKHLGNIAGVSEAHIVYGVYDIVAKLEAGTMHELNNTITSKVRSLRGIKSTLTMVVVESRSA
jgi:DNA-binding Lrp family transcriptional regulator